MGACAPDFLFLAEFDREIRKAEKSVWETDFEPGSRMPDFFEYAKKKSADRDRIPACRQAGLPLRT